MTINMYPDSKIAAIWLTQTEQEDPAVQQQLDALYADCRSKKYTVAIYHSGPRELAQETGCLLRHNRRQMARQAGRGM